MTYHCAITYREFKAGLRLFRRLPVYMRRLQRDTVLCLLLGIGGLQLRGHILHATQQGPHVSTIEVFTWIPMLSLISYCLYEAFSALDWHIRRRWRTVAFEVPMDCEVDEGFLDPDWEKGPWLCRDWRESRAMFITYAYDGEANIIPKRVMPTKEAKARFRECLEAALGPAQP
ncbi:MAG: hypothetical protein JXR94_17870 [Candidatus Hydrogenedentes bacterium]|nr:hypothetical protein [Candidatus Hydrogenedentota bacterium]